MKTAILLADGVKQIMFTPETDSECKALKLITPDDNIHTVIKAGNFYDKGRSEIFGVDVYECRGGYYRAEEKEDSVMFVLTPKKIKKVETGSAFKLYNSYKLRCDCAGCYNIRNSNFPFGKYEDKNYIDSESRGNSFWGLEIFYCPVCGKKILN